MFATASRLAWAAETRGRSGPPVRDAAAVEKQASDFANPLRLPGASGLYGVMKATDLRELRLVRTEIEVLPGQRTPYLAYAAESGGKSFLNPALLAGRRDEIRVRMVNQLDEPTIIQWHGLHNDIAPRTGSGAKRRKDQPLEFGEDHEVDRAINPMETGSASAIIVTE